MIRAAIVGTAPTEALADADGGGRAPVLVTAYAPGWIFDSFYTGTRTWSGHRVLAANGIGVSGAVSR